MNIEIRQNSKELFESNFSIICDENEIGKINVLGKLGTMEATISINLPNNSVTMDYCNKPEALQDSYFRAYKIFDNNVFSGYVYQTRTKNGLFKSFDYHRLSFQGLKFDLFPIGFGKEGSKNPIFLGEEQISLIEKDATVYNDLHNFSIFIKDERRLLISVIFASYMYLNACFKPGVKMTTSVSKIITKTTNKLLLSKYNSSFKDNL